MVVLKKDVREVAAEIRLGEAVGRGVVVVVVVLLTDAAIVALKMKNYITICKKTESMNSNFFVLQGTLRAKSHESAAGLKYRPDGHVN